jgi:hypothetical protein
METSEQNENLETLASVALEISTNSNVNKNNSSASDGSRVCGHYDVIF